MSFRSGVACLLILAAGCTRQSATAPQGNGADAAAGGGAAPAAAVDRSHKGTTLPAAKLTDLDGKPATLAPGKPRLVNLWATWCAPCVAELPSLDRAAGQPGAPEVVALDQGDDGGKVIAFLKGRPLAHVRPLIDRQLEVSVRLGANLPTSILYDRAGKEVWRVTGGRDWTSADSATLLAEAR